METEIRNSLSDKNDINGVETLFTGFREALDQHKELSSVQDITYLSKKLIFLAHRANQKTLKSILEEAAAKKKEILELFQQISCELEETNYYRYHRNISPAIQEYIEAVSFLEYLEHDRLLPKDNVESEFKDQSGKLFLHVLAEDYVLGVADLTGELMRYAINCVGKGDHNRAIQVCQFLRSLKADYDVLKISSKSPLARKMEGIKMNLAKVEDACYAFTIRGSEYPKEFYQHIVSEHSRNYESMRMDVDES
ncbi:11706_t:CDS:2 [Funneliformis geosporum]|uniref:12212_t:CDS:1 n=1 Tax=Funneliformis geosporum TaxID=1117311 RepID=A0A9W4T3S1_9GLOM|nr:12212_t:CDS:2 [Funneliformis geosporum]CAI2189681.1 11706_t:CDS:2 [Funneliformis geosporum]